MKTIYYQNRESTFKFIMYNLFIWLVTIIVFLIASPLLIMMLCSAFVASPIQTWNVLIEVMKEDPWPAIKKAENPTSNLDASNNDISQAKKGTIS